MDWIIEMAKTIREFKRGLPAGEWLPAHGDWMCGEASWVCGERWLVARGKEELVREKSVGEEANVEVLRASPAKPPESTNRTLSDALRMTT
jgi:hypothetical protein